MVALNIANFGGMIPRLDDEKLPDNMAAEAVDCDLRPNAIDGLPNREFQISLPGSKRAYHWLKFLPGAQGTPGAVEHVWLPLPSIYSSVCRNPLPNDSEQRIYWTNPSDLEGPWWSTYDRVKNGQHEFQLGITQPDTTYTLAVTAVGGTTDGSIPLDARVYVFTYVNDYGEESRPSPPSPLVEGPPDATWTVIGLPPAPANPPDKPFYPGVTKLNLYRTVVGVNSVDYFLVRSWHYPTDPPPGTWVDPYSDLEVARNATLVSQSWGNPPPALDGLISMPGGMMVGFTQNTLHFCEPYHPHTWPTIYDQSVLYPIVAITVWQGSLVILTAGYPSVGAGNNPANFLMSQVQVSEPCIARGSVVTSLQGVFYASQNGLIVLTYSGATNISYQMMTKNVWLNDYHADRLIACRHRSQYMAIDQLGNGFLYDIQENQLGFIRLKQRVGDIVCIWNDEETGDTFMMAKDGSVYEWDCPSQPILTYRWRSKHVMTPAGISFGACHISLDPTVADTLPSLPAPVEPADPTLVLPDGVNAQFKLYAGDKLNLIMTRNLVEPNDVFRFPSGFRAFDWQFEVVSRVRIVEMQIASTMKELQRV